jgi:hypothetical protein
MVRLTTPEPLLEASEQEAAPSASNSRHLQRALLWLLILSAVTAAITLVIGVPTLLFVGMQCYLSWCAVAALIQYLFLRIEAKDLVDREHHRAVPSRRDRPNGAGRDVPPIAPDQRLVRFARTGQRTIFFVGTIATIIFFRATLGTAGLSRDAAVSLRDRAARFSVRRVSVAMGALGSDVAIRTADIALMAGDLRRVPHFLALSDKTLRIINQNMLCGFVFIVFAIVLSGVGLIPPIAAAFIHEFGAFFVIFNSARLLRCEGKSA